ncbi:methionine aminotransferase [Aureitalea marina]|uniref:Methionine aminotransferase n=1 Tax=Aureitalea marina TaxID=930804 RepID=A0A2S7KSQ3_9FLAO|nr:methionine aminotransferase [Aureitalea marina]PQB05646.1 methionine aminotransferase [Aureitalea marina]
MSHLSKLPDVGTTIFTVMSKMAVDHNAINLSQGYPDFPSDPALIELVVRAMRDGLNQYAPMPGLLSLREAISEKTASLYGRLYDPVSEVTVTAGATQALFTAISAFIYPGDEVILFAPAYDSYLPAVELYGGKARVVQMKPPAYKPDWEEVESLITDRTKMLVINSPHNPTGTVWDEQDMKTLQDLAVRYDFMVLSDEVYEHIIFDGIHHQSASKFEALAQRSLVTASFGKTFHNTGWKLGYCLAPSGLMEEFRKVHQYNVFSVNRPVQEGLAAYLKDPRNYLNLGQFYQEKRDHFLKMVSGSRFELLPSSGTYFQLLDYSSISDEGDVQFAESLTVEKGLATIPTSVFNPGGEDFRQLRVCFAKTTETLDKAAEIINAVQH